MVRFGSDEWVTALDEAARARGAMVDRPNDSTPLVVDYVLLPGDDDPEGGAGADGARTRRFHVSFDAGAVSFRHGPAPEGATVTLTESLATAWRISQGETSAATAFLSGELRVGGDVSVLTVGIAPLAEIGDVFAAVRAQTEPPA